MSERVCHIYVMAKIEDGKAVAPIKVGISERPHSRLSSIKTSCPFVVDLVHWIQMPDRGTAMDIERCFHDVQAEHCLNGEWFDIDPFKALFLICLYLDGILNMWTTLSKEDIEFIHEVSGAKAALDGEYYGEYRNDRRLN